ncbi:Synaptic vesicle 2-related protein [Acropora cervicornis]|uniref:Synaptic vesicle 2-related protein n=1 Tax=Acropora cervicornis TaxID=6130 RepID=A0AAD9VH75_ACRCE|nr:Synaptic vesicle 2-related protein [Acropora cervicornis]
MAMNGFFNGEKPSPAIQPLPPLPFCDSKDGLKVKSASIKNYDSMTDSKEAFSNAKYRSPPRNRSTQLDELTDDIFMPLVDGDEFQEQEGEDSREPTYTLSDVIEKIGFGRFQVKIVLIVGFFYMTEALEIMLLSILAPSIRCIWHLSSWKEALITTVVFIGMMFGSSVWGWLADNYGRKFVIVICSLWTFYFGLLSSFSPHYYWIIALRCLVGFGVGGAPQSTTLLSEFLPSKVRSYFILSLSFFWALGSCFTAGIAMVVMPTLGWRWLLGLLSVPVLVFVFMSYWLPESCRYYLTAGEKEKATRILQKVAKNNKTEIPVGTLEDANESTRQGRFQDLLSPKFRKTSLLLWFIWFNLAFTYYGIALMTTEIFQGMDENAGSCEGVFCTMLLLERFGRKNTLAFQMTMITVLIFVIRGSINGAFQGFYVYTPECGGAYWSHANALCGTGAFKRINAFSFGCVRSHLLDLYCMYPTSPI